MAAAHAARARRAARRPPLQARAAGAVSSIYKGNDALRRGGIANVVREGARQRFLLAYDAEDEDGERRGAGPRPHHQRRDQRRIRAPPHHGSSAIPDHAGQAITARSACTAATTSPRRAISWAHTGAVCGPTRLAKKAIRPDPSTTISGNGVTGDR